MLVYTYEYVTHFLVYPEDARNISYAFLILFCLHTMEDLRNRDPFYNYMEAFLLFRRGDISQASRSLSRAISMLSNADFFCYFLVGLPSCYELILRFHVNPKVAGGQ